MIVPFKYYLHDSDYYEGMEWALRDTDVEWNEEMYDKVGRPFYEVTLECELDTETGEVRLIKASL